MVVDFKVLDCSFYVVAGRVDPASWEVEYSFFSAGTLRIMLDNTVASSSEWAPLPLKLQIVSDRLGKVRGDVVTSKFELAAGIAHGNDKNPS